MSKSVILSHNPIPEVSYRPFRDNGAEWPQIPLTLKGKLHHLHGLLLPRFPNFTRFAPWPVICKCQAIFDTSAPNDPKLR